MKTIDLKYIAYVAHVGGAAYKGGGLTLCASVVRRLFKIPPGTTNITLILNARDNGGYEMTRKSQRVKDWFGTYTQNDQLLGETPVSFTPPSLRVFKRALKDGFKWVRCEYEV